MICGCEKTKNIQVTLHFNTKEFHCKCNNPLCTYTLYSPILFEKLEELRISCGSRPLYITSGFRCINWNSKIGGVSKSKHTVGLACDVAHSKLFPQEIAYRAKEIGFDFVYAGEGFAHLDLRSLLVY